MGSRDYSHHEAKKPKKTAKKLPPVTSLSAPPTEVEVIGKGKKRKGSEVEEGEEG